MRKESDDKVKRVSILPDSNAMSAISAHEIDDFADQNLFITK